MVQKGRGNGGSEFFFDRAVVEEFSSRIGVQVLAVQPKDIVHPVVGEHPIAGQPEIVITSGDAKTTHVVFAVITDTSFAADVQFAVTKSLQVVT